MIEPWKGERGPPFTRVFKPALINFLAGLSDKFTDYASVLKGLDPGGIDLEATQADPQGGPPIPVPGGTTTPHPGTAALQGESQRAAKSRSQKIISVLYVHINNTEIRQKITDMRANPPDDKQ